MNDDVRMLGNILGLWAHPDDETFSSGGLAAIASANGQKVGCITATRGEGGVYHPDRWPAEKIIDIRTRELEEAQTILGVSEGYWLDFVDGALTDVEDEDALLRILPIVESFQPDTIISFPPDGITGHDDHKAVARWARLVASRYGKDVRVLNSVVSAHSYNKYTREMDKELNIFFHIKKPDLYTKDESYLALELTDDALDKKLQALEAMPSQTSDMLAKFPEEQIRQAQAEEYFILAGNEHIG